MHDLITEWAPVMLSVDHCHMDHTALHEEECSVEVESNLCDFSPWKPY